MVHERKINRLWMINKEKVGKEKKAFREISNQIEMLDKLVEASAE